MGTNLPDDNPNIADLSDQNRPTKLGERYSQLYDNPWTEAYEALEEHVDEEQKIIEVLRDILVNAFTHCENKANKQMQQLQDVFFRPEAKKGGNLDPVRKQLKDFRKASVEKTAKEHFQSYWSDLEKQSSKLELAQLSLYVKEYVEDCFTICWMMAVQDPPVVLGSIPDRGNAFDKTLFREYTQSGPMIEFVVWPPLFLHSSGPILSKGVAQGYGATKSSGTRTTTQRDVGHQADAPRPTTEGGREDLSQSRQAAGHSSGDRSNYRAGYSGYDSHSVDDRYGYGSHSSGDKHVSRSPGERQYDRGHSRLNQEDRHETESSKFSQGYRTGTKTPEYKYSSRGTSPKITGKSPSDLPGIASQKVRPSPTRSDMQRFHQYFKEGGIAYAKEMLGADMYTTCLFRHVSPKRF